MVVPGAVWADGTPTFDLSNWDVVLTYEIDAEGNITYTEAGTYDKIVDCAGSWTETVNETGTTTSDDHVREFAIDYVGGEFGYLQVENGTKTRKVTECDLFTLAPISTSGTDWRTWMKCSGSSQTNAIRVSFNPKEALTDPAHGAGFYVKPGEDGLCYDLRASGDGHPSPYTGVLNVFPTQSVTNHNDEDVVWIQDWVLVGGVTWVEPIEGSNAWGDVKCPGPGDCNNWHAQAVAGSQVNGVNIGSGLGYYGFEVSIAT